MPDLAQEIFEDLDRQLFSGAAPVAETKRRESCIIAHRFRLTVYNTEYRAETAIGQTDLATILDLESRDIEGATSEAYFLAFLLVNLSTCWHTAIAPGIELIRIRPMYRAVTCACVWCADVTVAREWYAELGVW